MDPKNLTVAWTAKAKNDLKLVYYNFLERNSKETSLKIRNEIFAAPGLIVFPEQFQFDENRNDLRRIIVCDFKILYETENNIITIITVLDCRRLPSKI